VREALRALEEAGLIKNEKNRGSFVRIIALEEADKYFGKTELRDKLTDPDRACDWPDIVSSFKYSNLYDYSLGAARWDENSTAGKTWSAIMTELKRSMYRTKPTDVLFIE
jgi:hypothetical protein